MTELYKSYRIIDGKKKLVIVDENSNILNKSPNREELKDLKIETFSRKKLFEHKGYLLKRLRDFYEENRRIPEERDFVNNRKYPSFGTYQNIFGSWDNAIIEAGLWENVITSQILVIDAVKTLES